MRSLIFLLLLSFNTSAALYDRGNGLIYDDVLDITWLQDANYSQTSGFDADGRMGWNAANTWTSQLQYAGYDGWRLASAGNPPASNLNVTTGELGHMFYINLGNTAGSSILSNLSFSNAAFEDGTESFFNVQPNTYWLAEELAGNTFFAWGFDTSLGDQNQNPKTNGYFSWAVHDGDIGASPVPLPAAFWLFTSGLISLRLFKR